MLMFNWYMINTFLLNLGTATELIFVVCKLTYCIEFTKSVDLISFFGQWISVSIISEECCCFGSIYVIAVAPIVWVFSSYLDIY